MLSSERPLTVAEQARLAIADSLEGPRAELERHLGPLSNGPVAVQLEQALLALSAAIAMLRGELRR